MRRTARALLIATAALVALVAVASIATGRVVVRSASVALPADLGTSEPSATAVCPRGKRVVLGGVRRSELAPNGAVTISRFARTGRRRWSASGVNYNAGASQEHTLTAIAYCGVRPRGRIRAVSASVTAPTQQQPADPNSSVTATCPRGKRLLFGGYDQGPPTGPQEDMYVAAAHRTSPRQWRVEAINFGDPNTLTAIAYCSRRAPRVTTVSLSTTIPGNASADLSPRCPKGRRLLFGGYLAEVTYSDGFALLNKLVKDGPRRWTVGADNATAIDEANLQAFAYCARKRR